MLAILQFDSAGLPLLERMLDEGRLPILAGLKREGGWETLETPSTLLQSSTYPTLYTGIDVTEHGLYSAFPWSASGQRVRFMQYFPKPPTVWDRVAAAGGRSLVIDPYQGWSPREMNGVWLSGWHFEDRMVLRAGSVPRRARRRLARRHGRPPLLDDVYGRPDPARLLALRESLVAAPGRVAETVAELVDRDSFDFLWINLSAAHKAGHHLWDPLSLIEEPVDEPTKETLRRGLEDVYEAVDAALGRILEALPANADVIVHSPIGMGSNTSRADLLPGMLDAVLSNGGTRRGKARSGFQTPVWSLRARVPVSWRTRIARLVPNPIVADLTTRLYLRADWERTRWRSWCGAPRRTDAGRCRSPAWLRCPPCGTGRSACCWRRSPCTGPNGATRVVPGWARANRPGHARWGPPRPPDPRFAGPARLFRRIRAGVILDGTTPARFQIPRIRHAVFLTATSRVRS